ncbi:MAG: TIGR01777 family oxidoreductase [Proteobacteria bacterium]|nr:TIGR01777 family oxidoreductase [Pseudomonadota bacterium]
MKIVVFGGSGFIGKPLVTKLKSEGHEVIVSDVRRNSNFANDIRESDAVINLGGHPLFKDRWTDRVKSLIYDSRIESTKKIVEAIGFAKCAGAGPKVFISSSAIGYYGSSGQEILNEKAPSGSDFLAFVCRDWEEQAFVAQKHFHVRTVVIRTGVVLGHGGGALDKLLLPFKLGGGTLIGNGKQYFSWIHLDDEVALYLHALNQANLTGALNAVAPNPVTNEEFSHSLAKVIGLPQIGLVGPSFVQTLVGMGTKAGLFVGVGGAAEVIAHGQRVVPEKALETAFKFKYSNIEDALKNIVS